MTAAFLPDNRAFVGFTSAAWALWDLKNDRMTTGGYTNGSEVNRSAVSSLDGRMAALAGDRPPTLKLFDQKRRVFYDAAVPVVAPDCLQFTPDSRHLLVGCVDGSLHYVAVTLPGEEAAAVVKAPSPSLPDLPFDAGWDKPVDPDSDCKFLINKNTLVIEVPGEDHDLGAERGVMNARRLLARRARRFHGPSAGCGRVCAQCAVQRRQGTYPS